MSKNLYVPILKWKGGEKAAIEQLPPYIQERILPLFEIPKIDYDYDKKMPKKTLDSHLKNFGAEAKKIWKVNQPFFIDLGIYSLSDYRLINGESPINSLTMDIRKHGLRSIPVTGLKRSFSYQEDIKSIIKKDDSGVCIRITSNDFVNLEKKLIEFITELSITPSDTDIIIDLEYVVPREEVKNLIAVRHALGEINRVMGWRSIILCSTSIPEFLPPAPKEENSFIRIPRSDKILWSLLNDNSVTFGDYGVANPKILDIDPKKLTVSANIRYTSTDDFIISKGSSIRKKGWGQIIPMAQELITLKEYCGMDYSEGDKYIWYTANELLFNKDGSIKTGNSETWRTIGTNHHIIFVVNELSN
jgi:hypothetical protein